MIFEKMRDAVDTLMPKIFTQSFNQELSQGILPIEKFTHYLQQDVLYLADFSRALSLTAARLTCNEQAHHYMQFAVGAINAEKDLHLNYLKKHQLPVSTEQSPACFMYTNYLLRMASMASVEEAVSSLLPCFWVYREVGKKIAELQSPNNPYETWITLYSGESFDSSVQLAIDVTNTLAESASLKIQTQMISAFVRSTQLEWHFWESAYRLENWAL